MLNSPVPLQDSDNPDLRDRGYIYWRLLSTDPVTAKEVVLSEKPLISEETDLIEPTLLDELICHIGSLASVYHKPPSAFVEGSHGIHRKHLPVQHSRSDIQTLCMLLQTHISTPFGYIHMAWTTFDHLALCSVCALRQMINTFFFLRI